MTLVITDTEQCASILVVLTSAFQTFSSMEPFPRLKYEGWNFNSGNYLFTTDTK